VTRTVASKANAHPPNARKTHPQWNMWMTPRNVLLDADRVPWGLDRYSRPSGLDGGRFAAGRPLRSLVDY
jgi:hypothetical protein